MPYLLHHICVLQGKVATENVHKKGAGEVKQNGGTNPKGGLPFNIKDIQVCKQFSEIHETEYDKNEALDSPRHIRKLIPALYEGGKKESKSYEYVNADLYEPLECCFLEQMIVDKAEQSKLGHGKNIKKRQVVHLLIAQIDHTKLYQERCIDKIGEKLYLSVMKTYGYQCEKQWH